MAGRRYCFTLNNYRFEDLCIFATLSDIKYIIIGHEVGESGTRHLQGYISFTKVVRFSTVKKIHNKAHWEIAKGNEEQNFKYCSKQGDYWEDGHRCNQGDRKDLRALSDAVVSGASVNDLAIEAPNLFVQYHRGLRELEKICKKNSKDRIIEVTIRWGKPRTGKTRFIWENEDRDEVFSVNLCDNVPFDGYNGESVILFDDFNGDYEITTMLKWLDRYPLRINIKGSFTYANWNKIYFTSNIDPTYWFNNSNKDHKAAFMARVTTVTEVVGVILDPTTNDSDSEDSDYDGLYS